MFYPDYAGVEDSAAQTRFEALWQTKLDPNKGLTVVEITDAIHEGTISGMYIMGENPAMSDPNLNHTRVALAKLDHLVVQDIFLTETATYADVILPASAFPITVPAFLLFDITDKSTNAVNLPSKYFKGLFPEYDETLSVLQNDLEVKLRKKTKNKAEIEEYDNIDDILDKLSRNKYDRNCLTKKEINILEKK